MHRFDDRAAIDGDGRLKPLRREFQGNKVMTVEAEAPLITIGLGVFNGERWIGNAIESLLAQSFRDFVLLISDNCSTDRTYEICSGYAARDERIELVRTPQNVGAAENFNRMCRMATGKYFKYASCNDLCNPDFLLRCVEVLERNEDVVVCYPRAMLLDDETGEAEEYEHTLHLMSDNPLERFKTYLETVRLNNAEQGLIRLDALRKTMLQEQFVGSDVNFMAELAVYGKFYEVPEPLFFRRHGKQSMSARRSKAEVVFLYAPGAQVLLWQDWKRMLAFSRMAMRVRLGFSGKMRLLLYLGRKWRFAVPDLRADARQALRYATGRLRHIVR